MISVKIEAFDKQAEKIMGQNTAYPVCKNMKNGIEGETDVKYQSSLKILAAFLEKQRIKLN